MAEEPISGYHPKGEEPNISPPRDLALANFALEFFHMNQPGWPPNGQRGVGRFGNRHTLFWPTEKSYRWMNEHE